MSLMILGLLLAVLIPTMGDGPAVQNFTVVPADPRPAGPDGASNTTDPIATPSHPRATSPDASATTPGETVLGAGSSGPTTNGPTTNGPTTNGPTTNGPTTNGPTTPGAKTSSLRSPRAIDPGTSAPVRSAPGSAVPARPQPVGADTTGVPKGTDLTVHHGDLVITQAGATYDALDIRGFVAIEAPNVTIRRSIIRGGVAESSKALVSDTDPAGRNFVIADSELVPDHPSVFIDGLAGWNYTATRLDIHGTVDAIKVFGDHVRIESSWLHDLTYYDSDPAQNGGPTHNDGVQVLSGDDIDVAGNRIAVTAQENSGMQVTEDHGATTNLRFEDNQVDGGTCSVKLSNNGAAELGPVTVRGNTFGRATGIAGCAVLATHATHLSASGNHWRDTGGSVTPVIYG